MIVRPRVGRRSRQREKEWLFYEKGRVRGVNADCRGHTDGRTNVLELIYSILVEDMTRGLQSGEEETRLNVDASRSGSAESE